jgi:hypothetical protein
MEPTSIHVDFESFNDLECGRDVDDASRMLPDQEIESHCAAESELDLAYPGRQDVGLALEQKFKSPFSLKYPG